MKISHKNIFSLFTNLHRRASTKFNWVETSAQPREKKTCALFSVIFIFLANQSVFNGHVITSLNRYLFTSKSKQSSHSCQSNSNSYLPAQAFLSLKKFFKWKLHIKFSALLWTNLKSESSYLEKWKVSNCSLLFFCAIGSILGFYEVGKYFCNLCTFFASLCTYVYFSPSKECLPLL